MFNLNKISRVLFTLNQLQHSLVNMTYFFRFNFRVLNLKLKYSGMNVIATCFHIKVISVSQNYLNISKANSIFILNLTRKYRERGIQWNTYHLYHQTLPTVENWSLLTYKRKLERWSKLQYSLPLELSPSLVN